MYEFNLPFLQFGPPLAERSTRDAGSLRIFTRRVLEGQRKVTEYLPSEFAPEAPRYSYESASEGRILGRDWRGEINRYIDGGEVDPSDIELISGDVVEYGVVDD